MTRTFSIPNSPAQGISLAEVLITLALAGLVAALAIAPVLNTKGDANQWSRITEDFVRHLSAVHAKSKLQYGDGPYAAVKVDESATCPGASCGQTTAAFNFSSGALLGISALLKDWESTTPYAAGPPKTLTYPAGLVLYLVPDDSNITDASNQIPNNGDNNLDAGTTDDIMWKDSSNTTNDWEWLLLDMNGTASPNSVGPTGDRVLLYVEDATGRVLTAWQKCKEIGTVTGGPTCNVDSAATCQARTTGSNVPTYRCSFYDVKKQY